MDSCRERQAGERVRGVVRLPRLFAASTEVIPNLGRTGAHGAARWPVRWLRLRRSPYQVVSDIKLDPRGSSAAVVCAGVILLIFKSSNVTRLVFFFFVCVTALRRDR